MREYIQSLDKALMKGLRAFQESTSNNLMLDECFNIAIGENGPEEFVPINSMGWKGGAYFNYLPIRDQVGTLWYWYPVFDGHILVGDTVPSEPSTGLDPIPVSAPVEWVVIVDENNETWKMYPNPGDGLTRVTNIASLTGVGLEEMVWKGTTGENWINRFSVSELARYAVRVI